MHQHHWGLLCQGWSAYSSYLILKLICLTLIAFSTNSIYICLLLSLPFSVNPLSMPMAHLPTEENCAKTLKERERKKEGRKEREFWDQLISMIQKKTEDFFSQKKVSLKSLSHFTWTSWRAPSFLSHPHPLLFSFHYNNSNYVQTTKHASSNDSTDMGKLAHLHNNKCRFEPIESLLTFKWYKGVISKVCAYPGWLSVWMCREWSNSQCVSDCAQYSSV